MKRAQIEALVSAQRGQACAVASLHVLGQSTLESDDHVFLGEHVRALPLSDLLRWLARCADAPTRGLIVRSLASEALASPQRFAFEAMGSAGGSLDEHEWGEVVAPCRGKIPAGLYAAMLARTGGSPTFRALARPARWAPRWPLAPSFFPEGADDAPLEEHVRRACEPHGPSVVVADALFEQRYDEPACRRMLACPPDGVDLARWLFELERAGELTPPVIAALLPATTRWSCEARGDENEAVRAAYVRHVALAGGGEAGEAWLRAQVAQALGRGAPAAALLSELPADARARLAASDPGLAARLREGAAGRPLRELLRLRALLPAAVDEGALLLRLGDEAASDEGDWGPLSTLLPPEAAEAVQARVRRSRRGAELPALLDWLRARGLARRAVVDLALGALERGTVHRALIAWLADQLTTRSALEQRGAAVIGALVRAEALPELNDLLAMVHSAASSEGPEPPDGFGEALHCAFAEALADEIDRAVAAGDRARGLRLASALVCLDPPPRFRRRLCRPGRAVDDEIERLLDVVRSLTRHGDGRDATLHDAIAAVHALAGALV